MKKKRYLSLIKKELELLNEHDREQIISRLDSKIDNIIESGKSEQEAVRSLGSIAALGDNLRIRYHVQDEYKRKLRQMKIMQWTGAYLAILLTIFLKQMIHSNFMLPQLLITSLLYFGLFIIFIRITNSLFLILNISEIVLKRNISDKNNKIQFLIVLILILLILLLK